MSLSTVTLLAYACFVAIFAIALYTTQHISYLQIGQQQRLARDTLSKSVAYQLSQAVASYAYSLESIARDPGLIELIQNGDETVLRDRSAQLHQVFPHALALRIFPLGMARIDDSVNPPLSYACLDLIGSTSRGEKLPLVEVHAPNTPAQHVEIVRPVYKGSSIIGHLQLALDTRILNEWLAKIPGGHYLELTQKAGEQSPVLLGKHGDSGMRTGILDHYEVTGTRWRVAVWSTAAISTLPITLESVLIFLFVVVLMGLVLFLLKRSVSNGIRADVNNIVQLTVDVMRNDRRHDFHFLLPEFVEAARRIDELSEKNPTKRERDDDPNAISVGGNDLGQLDSLFTASEGMSVEELDDDALPVGMSGQASQAAQGKARAVFEARDIDNKIVPQPPKGQPATAQQQVVPPVTASQNAPAMPPPEIFKAYDIRGIVGATLTAQHAQLIGRAIGSEAVQRGLKKMAFARDGRLSGPELGKAFVQGVQQSGIDVIDVGMVPTPVLYFAATTLAEGTGVMLTGSHNPPQYNGFKLMLGGETLSGDAIQALRERIESGDFVSGNGTYNNQGIGKAYIDRILGDVKLKRQMSVVIDCGNGVAGAIAPLLFKSMGCVVTELYCDVDGKFPNHHPDPSKPENMQDLIATVKGKRADIGLAFDGDGDRLGVVDAAGKIIYPDRLMMLFASDVLSRNHGAQIIYDIKCSSNLTRVIYEKGGEPIMWKTGHSLIKAKMKQSGAALAGEMSGHIFFNERWYGFDDGLYSGARLLEILSGVNQKSDAVFGALPDAVNTPELNVPMREGETHKFIEDLMMQADFGDANITMIDGIRADFADGWGLVRASNTTPVLVLRFEGKNEAAMKRIQQAFKNQMLAVRPDLKLPF